MAIFSFSVKPLAAAKVGAAIAYQTRQPVRLSHTTVRPSKVGGLAAEGIAWPPGSDGDMVMDGRDALWSAAVDAERVRKRGPRQGELRRRAVAGRTAIAALPHELTDAQRRTLVRDFATAMADRYGCAVDYAIHAPDPAGDRRNHHAHLAWTEREVRGDGMGAKIRAFGGKGRTEELCRIRHAWEVFCNRHLDRAGSAERIDARTLAAQGIRRPPDRHVGPAGTAIRRQAGASRSDAAHLARRGEQAPAFRRAALDLARQVREARESGDQDGTNAAWRLLVANCRDAARTGMASGDALDLAKAAQAEEAAPDRRQRQTRSAAPPVVPKQALRKVRRLLADLSTLGDDGACKRPPADAAEAAITAVLAGALSVVAAGRHLVPRRDPHRDRQR